MGLDRGPVADLNARLNRFLALGLLLRNALLGFLLALHALVLWGGAHAHLRCALHFRALFPEIRINDSRLIAMT